MANFLVLLAAAAQAAPKDYVLLSPDKNIELKATVGPDVTYAVSWHGKPVIVPSTISLAVEGKGVLGKNASGVAYRFSTSFDGPITVVPEQ